MTNKLLTKIVISFSFLFCAQGFAESPTVGVKNFRSLYYSLASVTGVKPNQEINTYFKGVMTRLPKDGRLDEVLNPSTLMAIKGLASLFCKQFSNSNPSLLQRSDHDILTELSGRIYGRALTDAETKTQLALMNGAQDKVFVACTSQASSIEFLLQ